MPGTAPTENALEVCLRPKTWARWGTQKWDLAQTFAASVPKTALEGLPGVKAAKAYGRDGARVRELAETGTCGGEVQGAVPRMRHDGVCLTTVRLATARL